MQSKFFMDRGVFRVAKLGWVFQFLPGSPKTHRSLLFLFLGTFLCLGRRKLSERLRIYGLEIA
jgi:hypothetical protein